MVNQLLIKLNNMLTIYSPKPYYDGELWIGITPRDLINGKEIILHDGKKFLIK